ncbi:MAG: hypothetical protein M1170_00050 [Patescibacteria group bacterium]|nr:hypothetical protein [Patescibacteria group bacterium]
MKKTLLIALCFIFIAVFAYAAVPSTSPPIEGASLYSLTSVTADAQILAAQDRSALATQRDVTMAMVEKLFILDKTVAKKDSDAGTIYKEKDGEIAKPIAAKTLKDPGGGAAYATNLVEKIKTDAR